MNTVQKNTVVAIHYTLRNAQGKVHGTSRGGLPLVFLHGRGQIVPGLERVLTGCRPGTRMDVCLDPKDAYGEWDEEWCQTLPLSFFDTAAELQPGMRFPVDTPDGPRTLTVVRIDDGQVVVDGNHPLAGQSVRFDVEVRNVRPASPEELQDGVVDP